MVGFLNLNHTVDTLKRLVRISEVFHWPEFVAHINDALVARVTRFFRFEPDNDDVEGLPPHFRRRAVPQTEHQMMLCQQAMVWHIGRDVEVVYDQAMTRRVVFRQLGCTVGQWEMVVGE